MSGNDWFEDGWDDINDVIRDADWRKSLRERQAALRHARLDAAAGDLAPRALLSHPIEDTHDRRLAGLRDAILSTAIKNPTDAEMIEFLKRQDLRARDEKRNQRLDLMDAAEREGTWIDEAEDRAKGDEDAK